MTLFKEILTVIIVTFFINLMGVLWLQFDSTRDYLTDQLESDLENMSTSLNMALSPHLESGDKVMIDSTLNAYFDGGYYKQIEITIYDTNEVITKEMPILVDSVPQWFIDLNILTIPSLETEVTHGWLQVGKIVIVGHPGFAYRQLWTSFVSTCFWLGGLGLLIVLICGYGINIVLRPLSRIQEKAKQIQENHFGEPLPVPSTKELKDVTVAVNQMTSRLKEQFDEKAKLHSKLEQAAYLEPVTGFGNRLYFDRRIEAWHKDVCNGVVVLIDIVGVEDMCKHHGWQKRDEVMVVIGHFIDNVFDDPENVIRARVSEHEFALVVQQIDARKAEQKLKELSTYFTSPELREIFNLKDIFVAGGVKVSHRAELNDILSMADKALREAHESISNICVLELQPDSGHVVTREEVNVAIQSALQKEEFKFASQPVLLYGEMQPDHYEVFITVELEGCEGVTTGTFVSVLNEYRLGPVLDKKVIGQIIAYVTGKSLLPHTINLSTSSLKDHQFIIWLCNTLQNNKQSLHNLAFEFNEDSILNDRDNVVELCACFTELGVKFGIDRVGRHFESLAYLQAVHPNYVKVDHSYTEIALNNEDNAYFVDSLCTTIHNLDILVIATHVENEKQLEQLKRYHFDGYQGYILAPQPMKLH